MADPPKSVLVRTCPECGILYTPTSETCSLCSKKGKTINLEDKYLDVFEPVESTKHLKPSDKKY